MQAHPASDSPRRGRRGRGAYLPHRLGSSLPASAQIGLRRRTPLTPGSVLHPKSTAKVRYKRRVSVFRDSAALPPSFRSAGLELRLVLRLSNSLRFCRVGRTRRLKKKNRSDKTHRRSRDMPAHYTAATRTSKRRAAESLKSETLHCKVVNSCFFSKNVSRPRAAAL